MIPFYRWKHRRPRATFPLLKVLQARVSQPSWLSGSTSVNPHPSPTGPPMWLPSGLGVFTQETFSCGVK